MQVESGSSSQQAELEQELEETKAKLAEAVTKLEHAQTQLADQAADHEQALQSEAHAVQAELKAVQLELQACQEQLQAITTRATDADSNASQLEVQLEQVSADLSQAKGQLSASEDIRLELSRQLSQAESAVASRVAMLQSQVATLQQQLQESHTENNTLLTKLQDWGIVTQQRDDVAVPEAQAATTPDGVISRRSSSPSLLLASGSPAEVCVVCITVHGMPYRYSIAATNVSWWR